jgi:ATP-dependent DNA ligase
MVHDDKEVQTYFEIVVKKGFEGVVVKPLSGKLVLDTCDWVKIKSKDRNDYQVTMIDKTQERLEFFAPVPQGHANYPGVTVGLKCANKYKPFIKVGDTILVEHQGILATGSRRHPTLIPDPNWK